MHFFLSYTFGMLSIGALAAPVALRDTSLASVLLAIAPASSSCDAAPAPGQCRTADQAAGPIRSSFDRYGITSLNERAAIISLMAYETGSFKYNENVFPGRPGQGTRNMQMINFNILYAESLPFLAMPLQQITGLSSGIDAASLTASQMNAVRGLLTANDALDFGSAAWFLTTQCSPEVRTALQTDGIAGWTQYITQCVGTTVADRQAMFEAALQALGA